MLPAYAMAAPVFSCFQGDAPLLCPRCDAGRRPRCARLHIFIRPGFRFQGRKERTHIFKRQQVDRLPEERLSASVVVARLQRAVNFGPLAQLLKIGRLPHGRHA